MSLNARSLATLGIGFGALAIVTLGFVPAEAVATPAEVSQLHQGGPDNDRYGGGGARQYLDDLHPQHLRELEGPPAPGPVPEFLVAKPPVTQPTTPPQQALAPEPVIGALHASETLYSQASDVELQAEVRRQADEEALILILAQLL